MTVTTVLPGIGLAEMGRRRAVAASRVVVSWAGRRMIRFWFAF